MGHRQKETRFSKSKDFTALYFVCYDTLLQNTMTDVIIKCNSYFIIKCDNHLITKCDKSLLNKSVSFFITKCDSYYKVQRFYYKLQHLLKRDMYWVLISHKIDQLLSNLNINFTAF